MVCFQPIHAIPPEQDIFREGSVVHLHRCQQCMRYSHCSNHAASQTIWLDNLASRTFTNHISEPCHTIAAAGMTLPVARQGICAAAVSLCQGNPSMHCHMRVALTVNRHGISSFASMSYKTPTGTCLQNEGSK